MWQALSIPARFVEQLPRHDRHSRRVRRRAPQDVQPCAFGRGCVTVASGIRFATARQGERAAAAESAAAAAADRAAAAKAEAVGLTTQLAEAAASAQDAQEKVENLILHASQLRFS